MNPQDSKPLTCTNRGGKKMRKSLFRKAIIYGFISLFVTIGLSGCTTTKSDKDKIVGTWQVSSSDTVWVFSSNGTVTLPAGIYNYRFENGSLKIDPNRVYKYRFSDNDDLVLTYIEPAKLNGQSITLTRKA